jgi:hypothetical protein
MKKYLILVLLLGLSLVFLTGCISEVVVPESDLDQMVTGKGTLKIYLTNVSGDYKDPPGNFIEEYQAINISISRIEGHIAGDGGEGKDDGYWETFKTWDPGYDINLMDIKNVSVLLASLNLKPNKYTQLRIFLDKEASLVLLRDGSEVTEILEIPSSDQTGIKLNHTFEIMEGMITKLTIVFDAEQSVVKLGNGEYLMEPVIELSSETYLTGEVPEGTGTVSGSVSYYASADLALTGIEGAEIELTGGVYAFANTTVTSADGSFSLAGVPDGIYMFNVSTEGYGDYAEEIEVIAGLATIVDVVFLTEVPGGISGSVIDSSDSSVIEGAIVTAILSGGSTYDFVSSVETDSSGNFLIEQLPVGSYDLTISKEGYDTYTTSGIGVAEGLTNHIGTIYLTPSTT